MTTYPFYKTLSDLEDAPLRYNVADIKAESPDGVPFFVDISGSVGTIDDENGGRRITKEGMKLTGRISVSGLSCLFAESGLVSEDTVLGIAALCWSSASGRRESFVLSEISVGTEKLDRNFQIDLDGGAYRSGISIRIVLYIKSPSDADKHRGLASGIILGELFSCDFRIGSDKFLFPVHEIEAKDKPLWFVRCDWVSVDEDPLSSDYVCVVFNKSHKSYPMIDNSPSNTKFNKVVLAEVLCSAMQVIIERIRCSTDDWNKVMSDSSFPPNTIAFVIQYLRLTYQWDFSTPQSLSQDIHEYVDNFMEARR